MISETVHARMKYRGGAASTYEEKRTSELKWTSEQALLHDIIAKFETGSTAVDIPCGTGRLHEYFDLFGIHAIGMDVNKDMSCQAREKGMDVRYGDITYIPLGAKAVDHAFCIRLLNWLSEADVKRALVELQRITRKTITLTVRVTEHPRARPLSLIEEVLDGFKISANETIEDGGPPNFRMITLEAV